MLHLERRSGYREASEATAIVSWSWQLQEYCDGKAELSIEELKDSSYSWRYRCSQSVYSIFHTRHSFSQSVYSLFHTWHSFSQSVYSILNMWHSFSQSVYSLFHAWHSFSQSVHFIILVKLQFVAYPIQGIAITPSLLTVIMIFLANNMFSRLSLLPGRLNEGYSAVHIHKRYSVFLVEYSYLFAGSLSVYRCSLFICSLSVAGILSVYGSMAVAWSTSVTGINLFTGSMSVTGV